MGYARNPLNGQKAEAPPSPTPLTIVEMASARPIVFKTPGDLDPMGMMARFYFFRRRPFPYRRRSGRSPIEATPCGGGSPVGYADVDIADGGGRCIGSGYDWYIWAGDSMRSILIRETPGSTIDDEERAPSSPVARRFREFESRVRKEINGPLNERCEYAAAQMASILFDMHASDSRAQGRTCCLSGIRESRPWVYRARYGYIGYAYDHGPWSETASLTYESPDFDTTSLRAYDGVSQATHVGGPPGRNFRDVARRVFGTLSIASMAEFPGGSMRRRRRHPRGPLKLRRCAYV